MARPRLLIIAACISLLAASVVRGQPAAAFTPVPLSGTPAHRGEAVRAWMSARLGTFGLEDGVDELRLEREEPLKAGGARVLVRQLWHGVPVAGADARAIVTADGQLTSLIAGFERDLDAPLVPRIAPANAIERAAAAAGLGSATAPGAATLVVERRADGDHLEWEVSQHRSDGEPLKTRIDAVSGEVLDADAGISHAVGRVYPTDPRQPLEERELLRLLPGPPLRANGYGIDDVLASPVVPVPPDDYRLNPGDAGFDQVNLYWHVDHYFHDFLAPLGYPGPPDSLVVRLHFALDPEVARTAGNFVTFGRPIAGFTRETSLCHDVVYHELGHTVLYGFGVEPGGPRGEASALHEALADYFAAAFTGDPVIGEWLYLAFPNGVTRLDQPVPPWDYGHYDRVAFGGGGASSPWGNGMILSSALWDLRQRLGSTCDSLVLESLAYLPTVPTWAQFANALFFADRDHHGAANWRAIGEVLRRRGIRGAVTASISGPTQLPPGQAAEYRALNCCGGTPGLYHWRARGRCRGVPCGPWRDLGDGDTVSTSFLGDSELQLNVESAFGDTASALVFVSVVTPSLVFDGPARVAKGATGTWSLRAVAAVPYGLFVSRQWLVPGKADSLLEPAMSYTFAATNPFRLTARLTDREGRTAIAQIDVSTFTDHAPKDADVFLQLSQFVDAGRRAEVHVMQKEATALRMGVYDIRGRQRLLLANGSVSSGERIYRWDTNTLEPGIYFLRATTSSDHSATLRFVVIR